MLDVLGYGLFHGTLWRDDEMIRDGVGVKTGQRMGHMSVTGEDGALAAFAGLDVRRKVFIHINTTNPLLLDESAERAAVVEQGWQVTFDGAELELQGRWKPRSGAGVYIRWTGRLTLRCSPCPRSLRRGGPRRCRRARGPARHARAGCPRQIRTA